MLSECTCQLHRVCMTNWLIISMSTCNALLVLLIVKASPALVQVAYFFRSTWIRLYFLRYNSDNNYPRSYVKSSPAS
ncbi:hypothetical protein DEU56DRAFT_823565 [Suillus clintonianus]|uniref:uncharacterized protein n=1 Tax=Suillus clintonianus TaxID=1904413 RepID=UPI001B862AFA|nr:uncharacterized protein DEU56DRAFT_823565 [Suillus clintonianus]KAG2125976.1 hypothetical protein DEU56DRAFT_823565 [Suillus clintonianus]